MSKRNIKVNKVYYISTRTARFIDDSVLEPSLTDYTFPYKIITNKTAFLRTSTDVQVYHTLSQIFIELEWPSTEKIIENDLEKILWLVKKRLYRISNFNVLKTPEPMKLFDIVGELILSEIKSKSSIPLRLLI